MLAVTQMQWQNRCVNLGKGQCGHACIQLGPGEIQSICVPVVRLSTEASCYGKNKSSYVLVSD